MKCKRPPMILVLAASILALPAAAETPPAPLPSTQTAADATLAVQKAAFMALPLATRKAAQDALVWLGLYNGVNDGDFGRRTRDSIVAFQLSQRGTGDGVLSPGQLQALLAAGQKARAAAGFQTIADPKTGARIGAPTKLIAAKNGPRLDFAASVGTDLAALYARLSAETPTRKVAYKAMKPNAFFVVSGQDGAQKFYSRFEKKEDMIPPVRGFTFSYPALAKDLDRVALAVANSFEPFPPTGETAANAAGAMETAPSPAQPLPVPPPASVATALIIAPGKALTALKPDLCPNPVLGGKPARFERTDATGLAILAGEFGGKARGAAPRRALRRSRRPQRLGRARRRQRGDARERRPAHRPRLAREERQRRPGVRPHRRPRRPRRADRRGAEAGGRRRAVRPARPDRATGDRRLSRRWPAHAPALSAAQRRRDCGAREGGPARGLLRAVGGSASGAGKR